MGQEATPLCRHRDVDSELVVVQEVCPRPHEEDLGVRRRQRDLHASGEVSTGSVCSTAAQPLLSSRSTAQQLDRAVPCAVCRVINVVPLCSTHLGAGDGAAELPVRAARLRALEGVPEVLPAAGMRQHRMGARAGDAMPGSATRQHAAAHWGPAGTCPSTITLQLSAQPAPEGSSSA